MKFVFVWSQKNKPNKTCFKVYLVFVSPALFFRFGLLGPSLILSAHKYLCIICYCLQGTTDIEGYFLSKIYWEASPEGEFTSFMVKNGRCFNKMI